MNIDYTATGNDVIPMFELENHNTTFFANINLNMYTKARNIIAFILEKIVQFNKLIPTKKFVI